MIKCKVRCSAGEEEAKVRRSEGKDREMKGETWCAAYSENQL